MSSVWWADKKQRCQMVKNALRIVESGTKLKFVRSLTHRALVMKYYEKSCTTKVTAKAIATVGK
jgi:hypothetical protein